SSGPARTWRSRARSARRWPTDPRRPGRAGSRPPLFRALVAAGLPDRLDQQELDLRVHAPQLVRGPLLEARVELGADPQQEALAACQRTYWYRLPVLTTGCARCSPQRTTSRLDTIAAFRSSSSSTMRCSESWVSASSTMLTAPATMRVRAAT